MFKVSFGRRKFFHVVFSCIFTSTELTMFTNLFGGNESELIMFRNLFRGNVSERLIMFRNLFGGSESELLNNLEEMNQLSHRMFYNSLTCYGSRLSEKVCVIFASNKCFRHIGPLADG